MHKAAKNNFTFIGSSYQASTDSCGIVNKNDARLHALLTELSHSFYSQQALQGFARKLIRLAAHAYNLRDFNTVQEASYVLTGLPISAAQHIGSYYRGVAAQWSGQKEEALVLLESAAENAPLIYRARAIQALGLVQLEKSHLDEALRYFLKTAKIVSDYHCDLTTSLMIYSNISILKSANGDHNGALIDLEKLYPLVRIVAKQSPFYFYVYQADLAYELAQVGRIAEAEAACSIALASPFAAAYPNWLETRDEIAAKRVAATPSVVAVPKLPEPRRRQNLRPRLIFACLFSFQTSVSVIVAATTITRVTIASVILQRIHKCIKPRSPPARR